MGASKTPEPKKGAKKDEKTGKEEKGKGKSAKKGKEEEEVTDSEEGQAAVQPEKPEPLKNIVVSHHFPRIRESWDHVQQQMNKETCSGVRSVHIVLCHNIPYTIHVASLVGSSFTPALKQTSVQWPSGIDMPTPFLFSPLCAGPNGD